MWAERLPARKVGRDYVIEEDDLKLVENRKPGRPVKHKHRRVRYTDVYVKRDGRWLALAGE